MPTIENALILSTTAHSGQKNKAGEPYIFHILRIMMQMETEEEKITALLHDIIEDTNITLQDLKNLNYDKDILDAIILLTKVNGIDYIEYIKKIKRNKLARKVKIADLYDNLNVSKLPDFLEKDYMRVKKYLLALKILKAPINNKLS